MNVVKLILVYMFVWMANRAFFSAAAETLPDYSAFSNLLQSRMKRDDHYKMECHQSGTGMFSFFAVPILMGDIMIDFMNMIDVMVDVMVTATGEEGTGGNNNNNNNNNNGEGGGDASGSGSGNNNNNNNNNNNKRRRRRKANIDRQEVLDSVLETFESQPSNETTIKKYEMMAKQHMNQYFATIKNRQLPNQVPTGDLIGTRQLLREDPKINRGKMVEHLALEFFGRLMESFDDFKDYCQDHDDPDCNILNVKDAEMIQIVENLKDFL